MTIRKLALLVCIFFVYSSYTNAHSICGPVSEYYDESKLADITLQAHFDLREYLSIDFQNEIMEFHEKISFPNRYQPPSSVKLIISGGTRPSAVMTRENHRAYATFRGIDYRFVHPFEFEEEMEDKQKYWLKVFALKKILECENIPYGSWVVWLDDDIVIDDYHEGPSMLDKYIDAFGHEADILVTEDNDYEKMNTGILLIKKTENTKSFMHMWSLYSNDPIKGYQSQESTLHEQQALKEFLSNIQFLAINKAMGLVNVVRSRYDAYDMNLNTFKREGYLNKQPWFNEGCLAEIAREGEQAYRSGDSFIHHGTRDYRTRLIIESLMESMMSYERFVQNKEVPWFLPNCLQWGW
ncbi:hypothetical protein [Sansalvadorimonas verongulae]|uniref:hypothetical protein n=1 Tax=Sansalvadorimonas verongulae TaxID=2172824 RepID=UPI0012BB627E|nr:hypothetical protein [Sansalvadorimonas verongulae]MTI13139.1 hypothetical protein [Sansalvadorimonas verongulae]